MKFDQSAARVLIAGSLAALVPGASFAQSTTTEDALRARIEQLDAKLKALEERLEQRAPRRRRRPLHPRNLRRRPYRPQPTPSPTAKSSSASNRSTSRFA